MNISVGTLSATQNPTSSILNGLTIHKVSESAWVNNRSNIEAAISNASANELFFVNAEKERYVELNVGTYSQTLKSMVSDVLSNAKMANNTITTYNYNESNATLALSNQSFSNLMTFDNTALTSPYFVTHVYLYSDYHLKDYLGNDKSNCYKVLDAWQTDVQPQEV
jgi:hypothetical protein